MGKIARYLNQLTVGNVFDSPEILEAYSTDRSVLKIKPRAVAFPESTDDVQKLMKFCYQLAAKDIKIPIAVRGSGLDEMGADLTTGLVISTEKLNKLLESDRRERLVRVQAGITLRELNTALSMNGLVIPIAGHGDETIGGLISNYPTDDYAKKYGGIMNYVERIEVILANGDCLQTNRLHKRAVERKMKEKTLEGDIYRKLSKIINTNNEQATDKSGYSGIGNMQKHRTMDLKPLFFGAEGTLGVITEVILRALPIKKPANRMVITFENIKSAENFLKTAESMHPLKLNLYDAKIIKTAEETGKRLSDVTKKLNTGYIIVAEFDKKMPQNTRAITDKSKSTIVLDELGNALTSYLHCSKNGERVPLLTDFYIPPENLTGFIDDLEILQSRLGLDLSLYGSYITSNYNLRPKFSLDDGEFSKKALAFLRAGAYIIKRRGGSLAGGSPEGRIKAMAINNEMSENEKNLYLQIKAIFDRYNIINPDIKLGTDTRSTLSHFRTTGSPKIMI